MKIFIGQVISTKMPKTATVHVERIEIHPVYKKRFKKVKVYQVHDESGVKVGDRVKFVASRPYSKIKKWKILGVVKKEGKVVTKKMSREKAKKENNKK